MTIAKATLRFRRYGKMVSRVAVQAVRDIAAAEITTGGDVEKEYLSQTVHVYFKEFQVDNYALLISNNVNVFNDQRIHFFII